ncbi:uncharacterized protein LOC108050742 [Drosophila rhopaloa]|uniref:Uncharacterized protein LOC108050742 n=1 Tax=Drosophila rhopaloa TaxID=1041015 RepID=A0A6P4FD90_DRORH|nr:uncharacterized protein LOC108050742 [Drosophila rhopaloa]
MNLFYLLSLILLFGIAMGHKVSKGHRSEMCQPQLTRQDLFDIAITSGIKVLIRQIEGFNGDVPISSSLLVHITTMASKYILSGKSIRFILRILYVACRLNKPSKHEKKSRTAVETAFLCLWEMGVEKCYSYKGKEEGDFSIEIP